MKINWDVRLKNKHFWITIIPVIFLLIKQVLVIFGVEVDFAVLEGQLVDVVETLFILMGVAGIINDPTTATLSDSEQALTYKEPK